MKLYFLLSILVIQIYPLSSQSISIAPVVSQDGDFFALLNDKGVASLYESLSGRIIHSLDVGEAFLSFSISKNRTAMLFSVPSGWYYQLLTFPQTLYRLENIVFADFQDSETLVLIRGDGLTFSQSLVSSNQTILFRSPTLPLAMNWNDLEQVLNLLYTDRVVAFNPANQNLGYGEISKFSTEGLKIGGYFTRASGTYLLTNTQGASSLVSVDTGTEALAPVEAPHQYWTHWDRYAAFWDGQFFNLIEPESLKPLTRLSFPGSHDLIQPKLTRYGLVGSKNNHWEFISLHSKSITVLPIKSKIERSSSDENPARAQASTILPLIVKALSPDGVFEVKIFETGWVEVHALRPTQELSTWNLNSLDTPISVEFLNTPAEEIKIQYFDHIEWWDWQKGTLVRKSSSNP